MNVEMYLGSSQAQASGTQTMAHVAQQGLELLKSNIGYFTSDTELESQAYDTAKIYFGAAYDPLIQGAILLAEATAEAVAKLPEKYLSDVDSIDLKSSELEQEIQRWAQQIQNMQDQILAVKDLLPVSSERVQLINEINGVISDYGEIKRSLEEKLQRLLTFDAFSQMLFTEVTSLKNTMNQGLAQVQGGQGWNPQTKTFNLTNIRNTEWARILGEKWQERKKRQMKAQDGVDLDALLSGRMYRLVDIHGKKVWMWVEDMTKISPEDFQATEAYNKWTDRVLDIYGREIKPGDIDNLDPLTLLALELRKGLNLKTGMPLTDTEKLQRYSLVASLATQTAIAGWYAAHPLTADQVELKNKTLKGNKDGKNYTLDRNNSNGSYGYKKVEVGNNFKIGPNAKNHLVNSEGFVRKKGKGVVGGHNMDSFYDELIQQGFNVDDCIINKKPHPTIEGIYEIDYRVPKEVKGQLIPNEYKRIPEPKTVYDPNIFSNEEMYKWGLEAMQNGTINGRIVKGSSNGIEFTGYLDTVTGEITNFHPSMKK